MASNPRLSILFAIRMNPALRAWQIEDHVRYGLRETQHSRFAPHRLPHRSRTLIAPACRIHAHRETQRQGPRFLFLPILSLSQRIARVESHAKLLPAYSPDHRTSA